MKHDTTEPSIPKEVITYAAALCEAKLSEVARNTNQPEQELREWVAVFLLSSWTGISNYLPSLRGATSRLYPAARKMAMAHNSHSQSSQSASNSPHQVAKATASSKKGYKYPKGTHWTQQAKNKKRLKEQVWKMHVAKGHKMAA